MNYHLCVECGVNPVTAPGQECSDCARGSKTKLRSLVPALVLGAVALVGCSSPAPAPVTYDSNAYAATVCIDRGNWFRVPDNYCPIGDGDVPGHPFMWVYDEYDARDVDVDVVYVGYPVERTRYITVRPSRVPTANLDRGRFPERVAPGATASTSVRVPSMPVERKAPSSSTVRRGGLGVPSARATNAPQPNRDTSSPAPGRTTAAPKTVPSPKATPPRVSGSRPVTSSSPARSGRR